MINPPANHGRREAGERVGLLQEIRVDPRATRVCCENLIEPQLAEVRDRFGQTLLAAVWCCPTCGRITW